MDDAQEGKGASSPVEAQEEIAHLLARGAYTEAEPFVETALARWPKNSKLQLLKGEVLGARSPALAAVHYAALAREPNLAPWAMARLADLFPISELAGDYAVAIAEGVSGSAVERRLKETILDSLLSGANSETKAAIYEIAGAQSGIFKYESKLAVARTEAGDFAGATAILKRAWNERRLPLPGAILYADLLAASGELETAIGLLEELYAAHPEHADISRRLTMLQQRARNFDRAADIFEQAIMRWPQDWMLVYRLNRLPVAPERHERLLDILFARAGDGFKSNERYRFQLALAALHGENPARGFALLDHRFAEPVSILASPVQKALKARAPNVWREASRLSDDRTKEVQITKSANARATVVLTTGITFGNLPLSFVDGLFAAHRFNVIYLRDFGKRAYLRGVSALGASEDETIGSLKRMAEELGAKSLIAMGSSSGGFSALRVGALMGADSAVSFSGPTALSTYFDSTRVSAWNPNYFVKAQLDREGDLPLDLVPLLSRAGTTKLIQFFGADSPDDARQARRIESCPNVSLRPVPKVSDHFVIDHMIGDGSFETLLEDLA
jgi:thioredoxin-like negative regulator of GroEL